MISIPASPLSAHYFSDGGHAAQGKTSSLRLGQKSQIPLFDCFGRRSPDNRNNPSNATDVLLIDSLSESIKLAFQNAWAIAEMLRLLLDKQVDLWGHTAERIAA